MKPRHVEAYKADARAFLASINVAVGQDFHTLSSTQVEQLLVQADRVHYQKPRNANGSRARYFHDMMQRRAKAV